MFFPSIASLLRISTQPLRMTPHVTGNILKMDTTEGRHAFSLYPRSVIDKTELSVVSNKLNDMTIQITVDGMIWQKHEYKAVKNALFSYDLTHLPKGRIVLEAFMDGKSAFKGRINKR